MATLKSEFVELASELIGEEFVDFASTATFTEDTGVDILTQTPTKRTQTPDMIRLEYEANQIRGGLVQLGDVMLIGEYQLMSWEPRPDSTQVSFEGVDYSINLTEIDPAEATIVVHCRPL